MVLVGISLCLDDRGRWRKGRDYVYSDAAYASAVEDAGGSPVHLPVQEDATALVERLDALLLPGGDDFAPPHPDRYGPDVRFDPTPERQIAFDRALLRAARQRDLPILGVCYGMQLMALDAGGSLHYDLASDAPEACAHRLPEPDGRHAIEVAAGTKLAGILGAGEVQVNSLHHQAVASTSGEMAISATSPDGIVEAVENTDASFQLGVQWHPEKMSATHARALFEALVGAARAQKR